MLTDFVGLEFKQGTLGIDFLCSTLSGISTRNIQIAVNYSENEEWLESFGDSVTHKFGSWTNITQRWSLDEVRATVFMTSVY